MSDCLHCDINEMVQKHIESTDNPDIADLVARIAESLADTILNFVPEEDQATVLAQQPLQLAARLQALETPQRRDHLLTHLITVAAALHDLQIGAPG